MKRRVADIIMDTLVQKGVTNCFAVVGGGAMHLDNALALNTDIHKVFHHHEQACAMAAEAYARYSGNLAAVCVTSGPGATNAITGVMGAWQDSLPMIVLSGQVRYEICVEKSGLPLRYRGIQEFEIIPSVKNMTKYAKMLSDPLEVKRELCKAIDIAMNGRRGPVWLDIPLDIQSAMVEEEDMYPVEEAPEQIAPDKEALKELLNKLASAKRPCILVGNGVANSHTIEQFREFAKKTRVPVIAACISADAMYMDYDRYYGLSGSIGPRTGNFIVQNADVILAIGSSLGFKMSGFAQELFAPKAYMMAVDIDENEMKKPGVRVDYFVKADLHPFFDMINEMATEIDVPSEWVTYCDDLKQRFTPFDPAKDVADDERVCSYRFWQEYEKLEPDDSITVLGNNSANSAKLQIGIKKPNQRLIANNNCGSMGADIPEAVGAAIASGKTIFCVTGDGSVMMNLQELQTIRQNELPVKMVIFNNDGYNAIRQSTSNFFNGVWIGCTPDSGVSFPDFSEVAKTFGLSYMRCSTNGELHDSLKEFFAREDNVLLEIMQRFNDPITPKVMSRMNEDGSFSTPALEDMAPFISQEEHDKLMLW